jgi:hypothetical protein
LAGLRQVVETIYDKLLNTFRLARERPHDLTGFQARLAESCNAGSLSLLNTGLADVISIE